MRKIIKQEEPREWMEYRLTPNVEYAAIPELRKSLLHEQGYICAYCQRRIVREDSRIEHVRSRNNHPELSLDYKNMVICCSGALANTFHCDRKKGDVDLSRNFNLFSDTFIATLNYRTNDGRIMSTDTDIDMDINEHLNLNLPLLKRNRLEALNGAIKQLSKGTWTVAKLQKHIRKWDSKDAQGRYEPYCGIVIWYLKKKLSSHL